MFHSKFSRFARLIFKKQLFLQYDRLWYVRSGLRSVQARNYLLNFIEARFRWRKPRSYPIALQLEPTVQCQLNCTYCPRIKAVEGMTMGHMEWEAYERLIDEVGRYLVAISFWQWGEPLVHPRIVDMVASANRRGIMTMISTNGQVGADRRLLKDLLSAGLDLLIISIDGASQEVYEQFRAGGKVERVRQCVKAAAEIKKEMGSKNPLINVRLVATSQNESEIKDVRRLARKIGADLFSVKSLSLYYDADPENPSLPRDVKYRSFQYQGAREAELYRKMSYHCKKPWRWPTLRYDGTLLVCECDHLHSCELGNVFEKGSFKKVWQGEKARAVRELFSATDEIKTEFCRRCRYKIDDAIRENVFLSSAVQGLHSKSLFK